MATDKKSTIAEAVAAASAQLIAALQEGKSEVLKSYLEAMGRFRKYSFTNTMLIFCQNPYATRVAGFHTWKTFGRSVSKGQHGIMIMAPMVRTARAKADSKIVSIAEEPRQYVSFRPVYVFDAKAKQCPISEQNTSKAMPRPTSRAWSSTLPHLV